MPEYLAPAVYIEEVDTGSKPIEGVSTSTAGMIGLTERGPIDIPILITSAGEFQRWFGQYLDDSFGDHRYLPHAIEGFFTNGGKRVYVTRILDTRAASYAESDFFLEAPVTSSVVLLAPAMAGATSLLMSGSITVAAGNQIRIGTGSDTEYRDPPLGASTAATDFVDLHLPTQLSHGNGLMLEHYAAAILGAPTASMTLSAEAHAGAAVITLNGAGAVPVGSLLRINTAAAAANEEMIYVSSAASSGTDWLVGLATPLQINHALSEGVDILTAPSGAPLADQTTLSQAVQAGSNIPIVANNGTFATQGDIVVFVDGARTEARRIGTLSTVTLGTGAYGEYGAGWRFDVVTTADTAGASTVVLDAPAVPGNPAVVAGSLTIPVSDRSHIAAGDILRIGNATDADVEYVAVRDVPGKLSTAPDPGRIVLEAPLQAAHGGASVLSRSIVTPQTLTSAVPAAAMAVNNGTLVLTMQSGDTVASVSGALGAATAGTMYLLRVWSSDGDRYFHRIAPQGAIPGTLSTTLTPQTLSFVTPLTTPHNAGTPVVLRDPVMLIRALDHGGWGNRLRIAASAETMPLVRSRIRTAGGILDPTHIRLDSAARVEPGTILSLADAGGNPIDAPMKVAAIDLHNDSLITLAAAIPAAAVAGSPIVSLEFRLNVYLLRQPDPALPSRNTQMIDSEFFRTLSLDPRHSRYVHKVIGTTWPAPSPTWTDDDSQPLRIADNRLAGRLAIHPRARPSDRRGADCDPARSRVPCRHDTRRAAGARAPAFAQRRRPGRLGQRLHVHWKRRDRASRPHGPRLPAQHRRDQHRRGAGAHQPDHPERGADRIASCCATASRCSTRTQPPDDSISDVQQPAPAVRHQVRGAVPPLAHSSPIPSRTITPRPRTTPSRRRDTWSASMRAPTSSAACTRRRPTRSCAASPGLTSDASTRNSRTSSIPIRSTST